MGLSIRYMHAEGTRVTLLRLMALALLPSTIITHVFSDIKRRYIPIPNDRMLNIFKDFETQWIRKVPPYECAMHRI